MNHRPSPAIHAYMVGAGTKRLAEERDAWIAQYFDLLASGFAAQPTPSAEDVPKQGHAMLAALAAVFAGHPLPIAWAPK